MNGNGLPGKGLSIVLAFLVSGCSPRFNTRSDYSFSTRQLARGDVTMAIYELPSREREGFITVMERTGLNLLRGNPDIEALAAYARQIDDRYRYKVSRELQSFFYLETPEGYYASEHEVIWMHLLLSWGYAARGDYGSATVEAKRSADLLSSAWSPEGRFDDPFMRIFLAMLWSACDRWEEAQVDLRKAAELSPSLAWARELAGRDTPPKRIVMVLGGTGREPRWSPSPSLNPFRGFRGIVFDGKGNKTPLSLDDRAYRGYRELFMTTDSEPWYRRHFERDNSIQELIQDSRYGQTLLVSTAKFSSYVAIGVFTGVAIAVAGIAAGGLVVYLGFLAESGETVAGGVIIAVYGIGYGAKTGSDIVGRGASEYREETDPSDKYRFVRFLPEYAHLAWTDRPTGDTVKVFSAGGKPVPAVAAGTIGQKTKVTFVYYPDVPNIP